MSSPSPAAGPAAPPEIRRRGSMLVLSSPSGAGKTTISRRLLQRDSGLILSVSLTTRPMRPGETTGVDYVFVDAAEFARRVERGELLEHARVFGNDYGTPRAPVEQALTHRRTANLQPDFSEDPLRLAEYRGDHVGAEDVECRSQGASP